MILKTMRQIEQYVHTLIAVNSVFVPKPSQMADFFETLVKSFGFHVISGRPFQPGLRVTKPSGRFRSFTSPSTGETRSFPMTEQVQMEGTMDIPSVIEGLSHYNILLSGEWIPEKRPLVLIGPDGVPFSGSYLCEVSCHIRPQPVSLSCAPGQDLPEFGQPCEIGYKTGVFSHPWTDEVLKVADAGCARFWIEFEFGKFLLPQMGTTLDVLSPLMITSIEECVRTKLLQGWHFY